MNIGIFGTGPLARVLGRVWTGDRHSVSYVPEHALAEMYGVADRSDVLLIAQQWYATLIADIEAVAEPLAGKVILDSTNPMDAVGEPVVLGEGVSFAEALASRLPQSRVVKAANTIAVPTLEYVFRNGTPYIKGQPLSVFYCGDDENAKALAAGLIGESNCEPVDAGPLRTARLLEPVGMFAHLLAQRGHLGPDVSFNVVNQARDRSPIDGVL
jgi:8-hydroxy-5-deazaflavin:NADPH oxidoreductase